MDEFGHRHGKDNGRLIEALQLYDFRVVKITCQILYGQMEGAEADEGAAAIYLNLQPRVGNGKDGFQAIPEYLRFTVDVSLPLKSIVDFNP